MKIILAIILMCCALWEAQGYPGYYPYYGTNMDSISYGATDNTHGAMVLNRYYQPYYPRGVGGGMAAFMFQQPQDHSQHQPASQGYYLPDKRRQTSPETYAPPQQNEVFYPQAPEDAFTTKQPESFTKLIELTDPTTERTEIFSTTLKTIEPEITEPEVEEVEEQKPRKRVSKKKQVKRPIEDDDEEEFVPKMPGGAFFPMFFGWGGRSSQGGGEPGVMAIANAYSTGRGGVSSSHATAYGAPRTDEPTKL